MNFPQLINKCSNKYYGLEKNLKKSFSLIGLQYFDGISQIILEDSISFETNFEPNVNLLANEFGLSGLYVLEDANSSARIFLSSEKIFTGIPKFLYSTPIVTIRLTQVLSHEIAHHLISTKKEPFTNFDSFEIEENEAWRFAQNLTNQIKKQSWKLRLWSFVLIELSSWYFTFGLADWKLKNFQSAERNFLLSYILNSENIEASEYFWAVREEVQKSS